MVGASSSTIPSWAKEATAAGRLRTTSPWQGQSAPGPFLHGTGRLLLRLPASQLKTPHPDPTIPMPLGVAPIRQAPNSTHPAQVLLAFHGLYPAHGVRT